MKWAKRWNVNTKEYEDYMIPDKAKLFCMDMDETIKCAECAKEMPYGDGFTSRFIHTSTGMGFGVCEDCYTKELAEERAAYYDK